jgi:predicted lipoprotein with Yx(FWY)xxD motif
MKRYAIVVGTAVLGLSALTACGGGYDKPAAAANNGAGQSASSSAQTKLATANVGDFGKVVVDGSGRTLYVFDNDTSDPSKSNCDGGCAAMWPPVPAGSGKPQVDGVDASLVGTVTRSDGSKQLTLAGSPVYTFSNDGKAGEAKGQAFGGTWWVVGADGKKITTDTSSDSGVGYGY